ncbi:MAG TPA: tryptophan 7-halogenase [Stellaceae bacterium]|nr:tryptophan 7-halogenase [Stellaceae bacterium]
MADAAFPTGESACDVLVVGGGPGGSTIAALLAERGKRVVLVEKEKHPRFHIGESLLPLNLPLFEKLGVAREIERIGMMKHGAEFVSPEHGRTALVDFADAWDKRFPYAYQVRRSVFDHVLWKNAAAKGAAAIEECRVADVAFLPEGGALVTGRDGAGREHRWRTRFLVDASGRDTFLAGKLGLKRRNRRHNSAAIFGHFAGARRLAGKEAGHISIAWFEHGWFWFIPLADGTTSVGAVGPPGYFKSRQGDLQRFFMETIALCPEIADRLKDAMLVGPVTATGNYSYRAARMTGKDYLLVGDAFAFIDPVFSTGVYLAMMSGFFGADVVETCLDQPHQAKRALRRFEREAGRGLRSFTWYIYRVRMPAIRSMLMAERPPRQVKAAVLSLLAGDVYGASPISIRLKLFQAMYYLLTLSFWIARLFRRSRAGGVAPRAASQASIP